MVIEAREITELEEIEPSDQKKGSPLLKTHEEILNLFQEIETIEKNIVEPDITEETIIEPQTIKPEKQPKQIQEKTEKDIEKKDSTVTTEKNLSSSFLKRHEKEKIKKPKRKKHFLKLKKSKNDEIADKDSTELTDQSPHPEITTKQIQGTFTLKLDDQGNLIGLNIKKPKQKIEIKPLLIGLFKRKSSDKKEEASADIKLKDIKGISGKIKAIPKIIKSKLPFGKKEESKGSGISGVAGKIKGIFSRK